MQIYHLAIQQMLKFLAFWKTLFLLYVEMVLQFNSFCKATQEMASKLRLLEGGFGVHLP